MFRLKSAALLLFFSALLLSIGGCKSDDGGSPTETETASLVGTWVLTKITVPSGGASLEMTPAQAQALAMGGVTSAGYGLFINRSATNFVTIGGSDVVSAVDVVKLKPGECAFFRLGNNTPYALADTASVELEYLICSD